MNQYEKKGPYTLVDGQVSDSAIWETELDPVAEDNFDKYLLIRAVNEAVTQELQKRENQKVFESLMEVFTSED